MNIILYKCIKDDFANLVNNCFHFQKNQLSKLFTLRELPDSFFSNVHENITIVTAYWDFGTFRKGKKMQRTRHHYEKWASIFEMILNPVIVYTDSSVFQSSMENYRSKFTNKTMIYCVNRTKFWPFQLTEQIKAVFDQPNYPKFYPNTFVPKYSASQHIKFAVMLDAVQKNPFKTPLYSWLDVGYFRDIVDDKRYFRLIPPPGFDESRLSSNEISMKQQNKTASDIFKKNLVWVGGGMLIGTRDNFIKFESLYQKAVNYFLKQKIMNSDQQIIYAIYTDEGRSSLNPNVELQTYKYEKYMSSTKDKWFYLGYLCRDIIKY